MASHDLHIFRTFVLNLFSWHQQLAVEACAVLANLAADLESQAPFVVATRWFSPLRSLWVGCMDVVSLLVVFGCFQILDVSWCWFLVSVCVFFWFSWKHGVLFPCLGCKEVVFSLLIAVDAVIAFPSFSETVSLWKSVMPTAHRNEGNYTPVI